MYGKKILTAIILLKRGRFLIVDEYETHIIKCINNCTCRSVYVVRL